jgi:subtilisin family serine protease
VDFVLESDVGIDQKGPRRRDPRFGIVNDTGLRFWVRRADSESPTPQTLAELARLMENVGPLEWIAPVYRLGAEQRGSMVCPLPSVLVVKPRKEGVGDLAERLKPYGLREIEEKSRYLGEFRYFEVLDAADHNSYELQPVLLEQEKDLVEDALFDHMPMLVPLCSRPGDPLAGRRWDMKKIKAGWAHLTPATLSVTGTVDVCVIDTGVDLHHPGFQVVRGVNLWTSRLEGDGAPVANILSSGHGTACAGIVSATFDYGIGASGLRVTCRIMSGAVQNWTETEVASGITWAADHGAKVINMSFGMNLPGESRCEQLPSVWARSIINAAIDYAHQRGVVIVAGAGNCDDPNRVTYPARHPCVIAVGASDESDHRKALNGPPDDELWGSNHGPELSVMAPGIRIPTTDICGLGNGYNQGSRCTPDDDIVLYGKEYAPAEYGDEGGDYFYVFDGTSAAAPHVAGLAALLLACFPSLTPDQVRNIIELTAEKVPPGSGYGGGHPNGTRSAEMGYGRINVSGALSYAAKLLGMVSARSEPGPPDTPARAL